MSQRVVLVRHGETEWSKSGQHTGRTDIDLTEAGVVAAGALRARLADEEFDLVLTSPLLRARRTAELAGLDARAEIDEDLPEWDYGEYEGRKTPDIRVDRPGWDIWRDGCPGGESIEEVAERADRVIARIVESGAETTALVAHGHVLRIVGARWIEQDPRLGGRLWLGTAAVCELGYERERRAILLWNDTAHIG
jgi:probable phosphoglycerate mutase